MKHRPGAAPRTDLPLFVYGNLKPGELGHGQIAKWVSSRSEDAVAGTLWERDGMPLLRLGGGYEITGNVLAFSSTAAYDVVEKFEPATHYQWASATSARGIEVNALVALDRLDPERGGENVLHGRWTSARDPLFRHGLPAVASTLRADGLERFQEPHRPETWARYYRLQSALMLSFAALERIAFRVGAGEGTTARLNALGRVEDFVRAVKMVDLQNYGRPVHRADKPSEYVNLNSPEQFGKWVYQVRNNLMHQGKSARSEAELVRTVALDLHDVLRVYLLERLPELGNAWAESDPEGAAHDWRVKPLLD
jgi:gamma-glutamylcyclotransferase (GGCT)/AIG2-like uncharacterized protein YtfP